MLFGFKSGLERTGTLKVMSLGWFTNKPLAVARGLSVIRQSYWGLALPLKLHLLFFTENWAILHSEVVPALSVIGRGLVNPGRKTFWIVALNWPFPMSRIRLEMPACPAAALNVYFCFDWVNAVSAISWLKAPASKITDVAPVRTRPPVVPLRTTLSFFFGSKVTEAEVTLMPVGEASPRALREKSKSKSLPASTRALFSSSECNTGIELP